MKYLKLYEEINIQDEIQFDDWEIQEEEPNTKYRIITMWGKRYLQFQSYKKTWGGIGKNKIVWRFIPHSYFWYHFCGWELNDFPYKFNGLTDILSEVYFLSADVGRDDILRSFAKQYPKLELYLNWINEKCQKRQEEKKRERERIEKSRTEYL